jgi:hypothetical protein
MDEHVAAGVHGTPRELAGQVLDVTDRRVADEQRSGPKAESSVLFDPTTFAPAAGMRW